MTAPRVAIVGGGLTGLAAAWHLRDDAEVVLHEASLRLGGQIRTIDLADGPLDVGADAFLARQAAGPELLSSLGFGAGDLVHPAAGTVQLWLGDRLRQLPAGTVFGVPTDLRALAVSGVLGPADLAFVASEPLRPRRSVPGDRSVADLVGERFGARVVERLVEPLLGGVYAGDARQLSAQATLPPVWAAAQEHRSLLRGLAAWRAGTAGDDRPVFVTVRGGLRRVVERLAGQLGSRVRTASPVRAVTSGPQGPVLHLDGRTEQVDAVVLAVPAAVAARLLAAGWPQAARELAGTRTASVAVVALAYDRRDAAALPSASGVLVPRGEGRLVKAVTLSTNKWPHLAGRERVVLRASAGRIDDDRALALADDELRIRVDAEVRAALSLTAPAREHAVLRWPDALPQYTVGHHAKLDRIRHLLEQGPAGLHLGGASFDGIGLSSRAAEGARLANEVRWQLRAAGAGPITQTGS
ncbi:MAG: protoporphyrinogen oxidase [Nitriliruptoraceae bacterium]